MISFDLQCSNSHCFEAWFVSSDLLADQLSSGAISCPICSDNKIKKALMAPNVSTSKREPSPSVGSDAGLSKSLVAKADQQNSPELVSTLRKLKQVVEENCDYVGDKFADEARKISYGETKERSIYGETSPEEAHELQEEGIEFGVLPWPNRGDA